MTDALHNWRITWHESELTWRNRTEIMLEERRDERQQQRELRRQRDRRYYGADLWGTTQNRRRHDDPEQLKSYQMPTFESEADLAQWLGLSLAKLRWYSFDRPVEATWHYYRFEIRKKSGGKRVILAPKRDLKALQRRILHEILDRAPIHPNAHGFVRERDIHSNAAPHVGRAIVLNFDLKDFFPSLSFRRVRAALMRLGYGFTSGSILALLCTERDRRPFERGNQRYHVSVGGRMLIQGAPTSPMLANLVAWRLDQRLSRLAEKHDLTYTRYADDLTFSGDDAAKVLSLRGSIERIIADCGFMVNPAKTRVYRRSSRQMVTGLVVNDRANTPRELRRRVRAILHAAQATGLQAQNRDGHPDFRAYLGGLIAFIHAANPDHARPLCEQLNRLPD
ncbi:MAG: reverse transcriptase family protein [Anaerolineae bacterium]|jgi:retron-type reverse transcriptase|nr:reverse transcriptase family protein [Anaerolineae bacterium]